MKRENGFSLIEALITSSILSIVALGIGAASTNFRHQTKAIQQSAFFDSTSTGLLQSVRESVSSLQVNFNSSAAATDAGGIFGEKAERLPIAFSENTVALPEFCKDCPGRLGFVVRPLQGYRGLYRFESRMMRVDAGREETHDANFIVEEGL
jgi:prepilin-type N-terminal cleavage/methylation domain-containing protein